MKSVEKCENCGRAIGKLEQPYVWRTHLVCAECHVHLSAPAPASAASRPAQAPAPLPKREHYHARRPAPKAGPAPAPVALQSDAPAAHVAPMLLCTVCGHARPFGEVVSDHGKVICRKCALAAAAQKAKNAARDRRNSTLKKVAVAAVVLLVVGGGTLATYSIIRSRPDRTVVNAVGETPRSADAAAEQIMAPARTPKAGAGETPALQSGVADVPTTAGPVTLFPPPDALPETSTDGTGSASLSPAPVSPPTEQGSSLADLVTRDASNAAAAHATGATAIGAGVAHEEPTRMASAAPARRAPAPPPEGTVDWFVYQGRQLLAAGKYPQALDEFNQAMKKDRNHPDAWHGSGLCLQAMGDRNAALERLEKAVTLYDPPSRAAVYNCAAANLRENPMRAAKMVKDFLAREGADPAPDEALHGVMGKALFSVSRQGRQNKVYADAQEFYFAYNERLESARADGRGRWGAEWVPRRDAAEKWNRYRSRQDNLETLTTSVDRATKAKKDAWEKLYDQRTGMRLIGDKEQREGQRRYEQAAKHEIEVRQQHKRAQTEFNSVEKPPFPQIVKPVPMDDPPRSPGAATR